MLLSELLPPELIRIPLRASNKSELLAELVGIATDAGRVGSGQAALDSVLAREATVSTGIGNGVAVPHGRTGSVSQLVVVAGVAPSGIVYDAPDGVPVSLAFLLLSPTDGPGLHVQALGRIARVLRSDRTRAALAAAADASAFRTHLLDAERA